MYQHVQQAQNVLFAQRFFACFARFDVRMDIGSCAHSVQCISVSLEAIEKNGNTGTLCGRERYERVQYANDCLFLRTSHETLAEAE
jgi:hypothetical protein